MEILHIWIIDECILRNEVSTGEISETFWSQLLLRLDSEDWHSELQPKWPQFFNTQYNVMSVAIIPISTPWIIVNLIGDCGRDYCHACRGMYGVVRLVKQCSWLIMWNTTNVLKYRTSCGRNVYVSCVRYGVSQMTWNLVV